MLFFTMNINLDEINKIDVMSNHAQLNPWLVPVTQEFIS